MRDILLTAAVLLPLCAGAALGSAINNLSFIDHNNLRYVYKSDEAKLRSETDEIKRNLTEAKRHGINTYILFSRSFEFLVNYDFEVPELGDLSGVVWPADSDHRKYQALYARYLNEVLDYADSLGIQVVFHTNQFDFPETLYQLAGDRMSGSARVCPGKSLPYDILRLKVHEFFTRFPKCSGLQLTLSETQVKPTDCDCEACADIDEPERFARVVWAVVDACKPLGKTVSIRTWGGFENEESIALLPEGVICSTKCTSGDFRLNNGPSQVIGLCAERQEVEFDAWGEYFGYNLFPCYQGDVFAQRIKLCEQRAVNRLAVRLNWNNTINYIFGRPFGNAVNVYLFSRLAENPAADPDDILREYVASVYPQSAHDAAFALYKRSMELQKVWMTWMGEDAQDHSRLFRGYSMETYAERTRTWVTSKLPAEYGDVRRKIDLRRNAIDDAYNEAVGLVDALGPDVPEEWTKELKQGARNEWFVAQGTCDCIMLYAAYREMLEGRPMPDIRALEEGIARRARLWSLSDPQMMDILLGASAPDMLNKLREWAAVTAPEED